MWERLRNSVRWDGWHVKQVSLTVGIRSRARSEVRDIGLWQSLHESPSTSWVDPDQWMRAPAAWQARHAPFCSSTGARAPCVNATSEAGLSAGGDVERAGAVARFAGAGREAARRLAPEGVGVHGVVPVLGFERVAPAADRLADVLGLLGARRLGGRRRGILARAGTASSGQEQPEPTARARERRDEPSRCPAYHERAAIGQPAGRKRS